MTTPTRQDRWQRAKGHRIFRTGDRMRFHVPGRKTSVLGTFVAYVEPAVGEPYLEVIDHAKRTRCIKPDDVKGGS